MLTPYEIDDDVLKQRVSAALKSRVNCIPPLFESMYAIA